VQWLGRRALGLHAPKKRAGAPTREQLDTLRKFKESAYKCGCQVVFTLALLVVAVPKPWFTNTLLYWSDCTGLPCEATVSLGERFVYVLEGGFYLQGIPMVFLWETKRKDRWELFAHHVATVVLIAYSYYLK
jgi:ceramide synthetase